ncbi:MAG: nicotinate-nucleotide adenylyltransferase [Coprobacillaceae bacterium]
MSKIGIMGGSFDPVHKEHIELIRLAINQLELDSFLIIPVANNPWKEGSVATKEQRLDMLKIAISSIDDVAIDTIELDNDTKEKNYTIDTLRVLKNRYSEDSLFYIMGMDQASQFDKWKCAKEISQLVQLVAFERLGYKSNENIEKYHFIKLHNVATTASSSAIRDGDLTHLDTRVLHYITNQGIYLESLIAPTMSKKRFIHTKSMATLARDIAEANGLHGHKAYIAGMFHDIAKEMPKEEATELMKKYFPKYINKPFPIWHQWLSAFIAKEKYLVEDVEILQAIRHHTTASIHMAPLDMCIYVADKYDPSRGYDVSKEIDLCKKDVLEGFKACLKDFYIFSKKKNRDIDSYFYEVYSSFVEEKLDE